MHCSSNLAPSCAQSLAGSAAAGEQDRPSCSCRLHTVAGECQEYSPNWSVHSQSPQSTHKQGAAQQLRRGAAEAEGQRQLAAAGHQLRQGGEWGVANTKPRFKPLTRVANALSASRQCLQQGAENERANRCGAASTRPQPASPCRCHRLRACPTDQSAARPHPGPGVSGKVGRSP